MSATITTPEQRTNVIRHELTALVARAEAMGVTIRVSAPQTPLRMAENNHVVEAWPARMGPKRAPWMTALPTGPVREAMSMMLETPVTPLRHTKGAPISRPAGDPTAPQATKLWPRTHSG